MADNHGCDFMATWANNMLPKDWYRVARISIGTGSRQDVLSTSQFLELEPDEVGKVG